MTTTKLRLSKLSCVLSLSLAPWVALGGAGCDAKTAAPADAVDTPTPPTVAADTTDAPVEADDARGGRLFDHWASELGAAAAGFKAGEAGGPRGDGTLLAADGEVLPATGHSYRLKNLFGWDLRGAEGIYGPKYQNKAYVAPRNLLAADMTEDEIVAWLSEGDTTMPGYGEVLDPAALRDVAAFVAKIQRGELPHPDMIWALSETAPKNYTLNAGADVDDGVRLFAEHCASCHGDDGTTLAIHGTTSVGAFGRTNAYEGWIKMLNGHPGTAMHREIPFDTAAEGGAKILNVSAALCDRGRFPVIEGQDDVADGDERCGAYLK